MAEACEVCNAQMLLMPSRPHPRLQPPPTSPTIRRTFFLPLSSQPFFPSPVSLLPHNLTCYRLIGLPHPPSAAPSFCLSPVSPSPSL